MTMLDTIAVGPLIIELQELKRDFVDLNEKYNVLSMQRYFIEHGSDIFDAWWTDILRARKERDAVGYRIAQIEIEIQDITGAFPFYVGQTEDSKYEWVIYGR